jgi:MFS family permease
MLESFTFRDLEANIWKLYVFRILYGFFLSVPIIVIFWQENGLSMFEVMLLQSLFGFTVILLEVPSGYFADRFGRRKTLIMAGVFSTLGIAAYSLGHNFLEFIVGETLWALGVSLISGSNSAMFYDTLVELGKEEKYKKLWGKASSYYMFSSAVAAVAGGLIAGYQLRWALHAQIPIFMLMIPIAYSMKEPEHHLEVSEKEEKTMKSVVREVLKRPELRNLMFYGAAIYAALQTAFMFYQPYFKLTGLDVALFGFAFAGFNVISALGSRYADTLEKKLGMKNSLMLLMLLVASSLFLMSEFVLILGLGFIFLQQFARGFSKPVISDYINKVIDSDNRSTILSTYSLTGKLFMSLSTPVFGYVADLYTMPQALLALGAVTVAVCSSLLILLSMEEVIEIGLPDRDLTSSSPRS